MDSFVIRIHMVLPISEMHNGRVEHVEYNFDRHWAMFVDWIARRGDEAETEWGVRWHGPFIVSSRPFYTPRETTNVMITDNHTVVSGPLFRASTNAVPRPHVQLLPYTGYRYKLTRD
jgi:hypothetical protein